MDYQSKTPNLPPEALALIERLCQSTDIFELSTRMGHLIHFCKLYAKHCGIPRALKKAIMSKMADYIINSSSSREAKNPLYVGNEAIIQLLDLAIDTDPSLEDIEQLCVFLQSNFIHSNDVPISTTHLKSIVTIAINHFPNIARLFTRIPLKILMFNHAHRNYNSFYLREIFLARCINDAIVLTRPSDNCSCSYEYIILHELGHALLTRIHWPERSAFRNFIALREEIFPPIDGECHEDLEELFADCFAYALAAETHLAERGVLAPISENMGSKIIRFFRAI